MDCSGCVSSADRFEDIAVKTQYGFLMFTDCRKRQNSTPSGKGKATSFHLLLMAVVTFCTTLLGLNPGDMDV